MSAYDVIEFSELDGLKIDGFIQKPIRIKELLSILEKHLIKSQFHQVMVDKFRNYFLS
jgi:hypothetical protein